MKIPIKLNRRELNVLIAAGVVAIVYVLQGGLLDKIVGFMKRATGQMDRYQLELKQYLQIVSERGQVLQEIEGYRDYFTATDTRTPTAEETETATLLSEIEQMAQKYNVSVTALTPKDVQEKEGMREYSLELKTESLQKNLIQFLYALQSAESIFYPEHIQITATKIQETSAVTAQMVLVKAVVIQEG